MKEPNPYARKSHRMFLSIHDDAEIHYIRRHYKTRSKVLGDSYNPDTSFQRLRYDMEPGQNTLSTMATQRVQEPSFRMMFSMVNSELEAKSREKIKGRLL